MAEILKADNAKEHAQSLAALAAAMVCGGSLGHFAFAFSKKIRGPWASIPKKVNRDTVVSTLQSIAHVHHFYELSFGSMEQDENRQSWDTFSRFDANDDDKRASSC